MTKSTKQRLMKLASFACVLHCIIAPFLVISAPVLGHLFENVWIELSVLIISIGCGMAIIYNGYCTHKKKHAAVLFVIGAIFWGINTLLEKLTDMHLHFELLIVGAIFVLISYKVNHDHSKTCCTHDH